MAEFCISDRVCILKKDKINCLGVITNLKGSFPNEVYIKVLGDDGLVYESYTLGVCNWYFISVSEMKRELLKRMSSTKQKLEEIMIAISFIEENE